MQTVHDAPVKPFPGATLVMQRQPQQGENSILDLLVIDLHAGNIPCAQAKILWPSPDAYYFIGMIVILWERTRKSSALKRQRASDLAS